MSAVSISPIASHFAAMTTEAPPTLVPAATEAGAADPKRGAKRQRKETVEAAALGATAATSATPASSVGKKAAAKANGKPEGAAAATEDVAVVATEEGEKMGEPGTWLIVAKTVRGLLKGNPNAAMHCGSDALPALNARVVELIQEAIARAVANNRKTLKSCDF